MLKLCNPKIKVLIKQVNKPKFEDSETITINKDFKQPNIKQMLIPQPNPKKIALEGIDGMMNV